MSIGASDLFAVAVRQTREPPTATPFDGILEQSRDLICDRLDEAIAGMLDRAGDALSAMIKDTQNRDERNLFEETKDVATTQRNAIEEHFQEAYLEDFKRRCNLARKIGLTFDEAEHSLDTLELVGEDDLEETLKCNDMAAKLRAYCDEELVALNQRVGVLLGDADLQAIDNPFGPQVICDAYKHACRKLDTDAKVRRVLLKLFDDHVLDDIRSVYKAVNALLVRSSILPKIRYSVPSKQDRKEPTPGAPDGVDQPFQGHAASSPAGAAQDLFAILQNLVASNAAALGNSDGAAGTGAVGGESGASGGLSVLQGAELLGSLTRIQRGDLSAVSGGNLAAAPGAPGLTNVLRELKGTSVGAGMGQLDLLTLDIIAMLFDQLFDDPKVPNGVKGLIGRLQIPMLKVAIADKSFFSSKNHPARRLLDTIGEISSRLPADFSADSPLFERMQNILQELVDGFQEDLEIFTRVREQLHTLVAEEDQRVDQQTQAAARQAEEMENLALAKSVAEKEIKARVEGQTLPGPVREFLAQQWLKLLLLIHVKEGPESQNWTDALELMDQLIWSIGPKTEPEDRRKLTAMIPGVVKRLAVGLNTAGIEDEVRVQFFAELMQYHMQAISAPGHSTADAGAANQSEPGPAAFTTAEKLQAALGTAAKAVAAETLDFTAPITVKNPFGEGEVSVDSQDLDFTAEAARGARAKREASIARALDNLKMGMWMEFAPTGEQSVPRPARLIFVSPRKTRYLFAADRAGKEIIQCTRAEISRRIRTGEAVKLDAPPEESLFDRIMSGLLGKLRLPGRTALFPM